MQTVKFLRRKIFNRRGQALVLYALLIPVLFLFVGIGFDLGWYFINVSRLQNAADAAALAGAHALVAEEDFEKYYVSSLASNNLPEDFDDYQDVFKNTFDSSTIANGKLYNYKPIEEIKDSLKKARLQAEEYTRKNLIDSNVVDESSNSMYVLSATDAWSISNNETDKKVSGKIELKYKIVDGKNDVYGPLYYVVNLTEKIRHLFLPGWFEPMDAPVKAVVLLKPHYKGLIDPMQHLERTKVIDNWEYTREYKDPSTGLSVSGDKWNHYQAGTYGDKQHGIKYTSGNPNRTESVIVKTTANDSSGAPTLANGSHFYSASQVDSINIDMRAEVTKIKFTTDWDIGTDDVTNYDYQFAEGWSATDGANKRILFNVELDEAFPTRDPTKQADPLWVRIESDPIKNPYTGAGVSNFNSVRQVTLNFNTDNSQVSGDHYVNRPYVIFYTGPENIDYATTKDVDGSDVLIRHSQPVVLNLNENLNAIVYLPNSPVIINGNGHELKGFVIAKCYLRSVTHEDMLGNKSITLYNGFNVQTTFNTNYTEGTDANSNTVYFKPDELVDMKEINQEYSGENFTTTDDGSGNVIVREKFEANHYILLDYTKADHNTYAVTENGKLNENKTFAAYVNATYKEKYKAISGLSDSQITAVSFPDKTDANYNETTAVYYVDSNYVSDSKKNDNYVKVLVGSEEKYVDKTKLPYVKVRTNKEYFYVSVSDLRLPKSNSDVKGVRMIDNSYTDEQMNSSFKQVGKVTSTDADIYINDTSINEYGDSWKIPKTVYNDWKDWMKNKVTFSTDGSYFMLNSEISTSSADSQVIATYRKITYTDDNGEEKIKYAKVGDKLYYTKVYNNENNHDNYIIVDENGNMLTKPVTAPELRKPEDVDSVTENLALELKTNLGNTALSDYWNTYTREPKDPEEIPGDKGGTNTSGQYVGLSEYRKDEDYRIPAWERVYYKNTFNLSENSLYSYFGIDELWRVNYTYMNVNEIEHTVNKKPSDESSRYKWKVDDMFLTTTRAGWID